MDRLSEKLLAILLTLLLGLSPPLQGAMAGLAVSSDHEGETYQMSDTQGDMVKDIDPATHDCEQYNADDGCNGHSCSSGQCASCVLAVLPICSHPINFKATSKLLQKGDYFVSQLSSSLFRPPKS